MQVHVHIVICGLRIKKNNDFNINYFLHNKILQFKKKGKVISWWVLRISKRVSIQILETTLISFWNSLDIGMNVAMGTTNYNGHDRAIESIVGFKILIVT